MNVRKTASGVLIVLVSACFALAQPASLSHDKQIRIEQAVTKFMAASKAPGISVAVVENGQFVWSAGFGMADLEQFVPATSQTLYRLASISKSTTAVAAMQLWQAGKLDLDAPIQKYCPAFPTKQAPITTRMLLAHLSGIRHYKSDSNDDPEVGNIRHFDDPIRGGLQFFANDPLISQPGQEFHYTTHGYTVVGCAIEGASGEKYTDYMREHVFLPTAMMHTVVDDRYEIIPYRTRFYSKDKTGAVINSEFLDSSYKIPGGGWLSSADDMARFEVAILADKLISRKTRDAMWTGQKPGNGAPDDYALGWGWRSYKDAGFDGVGHDGGQQGTSTNILLVPDRQAGVVVLINMDEIDSGALAAEIMKTVLAP